MSTLMRVVPVFLIILIGHLGRRAGLLPSEFRGPANRLAYRLAVPCLIFIKISSAPFREVFNPIWIAATLCAIVAVWSTALLLGRVLGIARRARGTFVQASMHSNLGYIGLAVVYYGLGDRGLQVGGVFAAFYMMLNNLLSVIVLGHYGTARTGPGDVVRRVVVHPVILASLAGLVWSLGALPLPSLASDTLHILGNMGLPLALLLIGADLSLEALRQPVPLAAVLTLKNLALPALGAALVTIAGAKGLDRAAAVVLLGAPSATLTLVMGREMGGDPVLASAAITASTLASAATMPFWLTLLAPALH